MTDISGGLEWVAGVSAPMYLAVIPQDRMTATATSSQPGYRPANAIDGDPATLWSIEFSPVFAIPPQSITRDLGGSYDVTGLLYLPRPNTHESGDDNGIITGYQILVSTNGATFTPVVTGTWTVSHALKSATFPPIKDVRYVRLDATAAYDDTVTAAAIDVLGVPTTVQHTPADATWAVPSRTAGHPPCPPV